jgi:hypothetical protein
MLAKLKLCLYIENFYNRENIIELYLTLIVFLNETRFIKKRFNESHCCHYAKEF